MIRLVPYYTEQGSRHLGVWYGKVNILEDFDELPSEIASAFQGDAK